MDPTRRIRTTSYAAFNREAVFDRDMNLYEKPSDVPEPLRKMICESCFPPSEEEIASLHLDYCVRIVPHHQDTGGFFVALLEKVDEKPLNSPVTVGAPAYKKQKMFKDEPFTFLKKDDDRCRNEQKVETTRFRLSQEGIRHLLPYLQKQFVKIDEEDMLKVLKTEETMIPLESLNCKDAIREQGSGSLVLFSDKANPVCTWVGFITSILLLFLVGFHTVAPYVSKEERVHMLRMMGVDCSEIEQMMKSKRKQKAAADRKAAWEEAQAEKMAEGAREQVEEDTSNLSVNDEESKNGGGDVVP
ncbi:hypothetical protein TELCIR_08172 [Teladorsagia circumcincta]|uniref:SAM-dependent MTase RsmB/NOP-type domain-containing protein n=1 Tax=Teladorsagia circumcincta TaxID=45464 RepID=A0A2G9UIH7_TELCI|nr:hypothetical protein TELCIR_08172 [Teladorsagia circumcincta]